ncbi:hypothetical protein [uncultured Methanocorpusculum sp.]|nr:hypothetical protein [uncultured Methanocorpusculum sp.]
MRHEILYQYDLPIEILDDIPRTEEVLNVIYARSKDKFLITILLTRLRMLWGYPERQTVYRIYEMNYIDLMEASVRFPVAIAPTLTLKTVNNDKYIFHSVKNSVEEVRAALLTLREMMNGKVGGNWDIAVKRNLLTEEYLLRETGPKSTGPAVLEEDDVFEDTPDMEGDIFEQKEVITEEEKEEAKAAWVSRMIESTAEKEEPKEKAEVPLNDVIVFETDSGKTDDQWHDEGKGDAMILPRGRTRVGGGRYKHLNDEAKYLPEEDDAEVYVSKKPETPKFEQPKPTSSVTLEPRDGLDDEAIDKSLEALKYLRENGIITEDEYKKRCLGLFKRTGL